MRLISLLRVWLAAHAIAQDLRSPILELRDRSLVLLPPDLVATRDASLLEWSPDGMWLALERREPPSAESMVAALEGKPVTPSHGAREVLLWSASARRVTARWTVTSETDVVGLHWATRSGVVFTEITDASDGAPESAPRPSSRVLRVDLATGRSEVMLASNESAEPWRDRFLLSTHDAAYFVEDLGEEGSEGSRRHRVSLLPAAGPARAPSTVIVPGRMLPFRRTDGLIPVMQHRPPARPNWFLWDPKTGGIALTDGSPFDEAFDDDAELAMRKRGWALSDVRLDEQNEGPIMLFMQSVGVEDRTKRTRCFVDLSDDGGLIAPNDRFIAYVHYGHAFVRQVVPANVELLKRAKVDAERSVVISRAKQCAAAILMYAGDYDDIAPAAAEFTVDLIMPYLKNESMASGFIYTFRGGDMTKVENPTETEMGYIMGPGGRAVAYLDGSVRWVPDP